MALGDLTKEQEAELLKMSNGLKCDADGEVHYDISNMVFVIFDESSYNDESEVEMIEAKDADTGEVHQKKFRLNHKVLASGRWITKDRYKAMRRPKDYKKASVQNRDEWNKALERDPVPSSIFEELKELDVILEKANSTSM